MPVADRRMIALPGYPPRRRDPNSHRRRDALFAPRGRRNPHTARSRGRAPNAAPHRISAHDPTANPKPAASAVNPRSGRSSPGPIHRPQVSRRPRAQAVHHNTARHNAPAPRKAGRHHVPALSGHGHPAAHSLPTRRGRTRHRGRSFQSAEPTLSVGHFHRSYRPPAQRHGDTAPPAPFTFFFSPEHF